MVTRKLEGISGPTPVEIVATVVSPNAVTSPLGGARCAAVKIEVVEREVPLGPNSPFSVAQDRPDTFTFVGALTLGDTLVLRSDEGPEITLVVGRARLSFFSLYDTATPLARAIPELVPILRLARGSGMLCWREHLLVQGDRVRLKAVVEQMRSVVATTYRSGPARSLVARDDLGPVLLEEILDRPPF